MAKFVVLGGYGKMGSFVARDLFDFTSSRDEIIIAGRDYGAAKKFAASFKSKRVSALGVDIYDEKNLVSALKGADVCINCVQYYFNLQIMKACLAACVNYIDLGGLYHVTLKQLKLTKEFERAGVLAVMGCGSSPGITNVMAAYAFDKLGSAREMHVTFGGRDYTKYNQPFVLPYSMQTLIDEFNLEPAVLRRGRIVFAKPGEGEKEINLPAPVGKVKGFYGIHSELATFPKSFGLSECSFRLTFDEEFVRRIRFLIDTGFTSESVVKVNRASVRPREITVKIMDKWLPRDVKINDLEYLRVEVTGKRKIVMNCLTRSNSKYNAPAGSYDTSVPPSIIAQMIADGRIHGAGTAAPENVVPAMEFFSELARRKIYVFENGKKIN